MGCNNDLRKERQIMDKPNREKIDSALFFKREGDEFLREKSYENALNSYEKGLMQLFYCFSEEENEAKTADNLQESLNLNCSLCKIKTEKYEEAVGYLNEVMRFNKANLKAIYRISYCYLKLRKFEDCGKFIEQAESILNEEKNKGKKDEKTLFLQLKEEYLRLKNEVEKNNEDLLKKISRAKT